MSNFDWADLAFASKKPVRDLRATFIAAPRELSPARFTQMVKKYLPQGNILLGISKEPYVIGLENQAQFKMLTADAVQAIVDKVNNSSSPNKLYVLSYAQRDVAYVLEKLRPPKVLLINGSWYHAFHLRPEYYELAKNHIGYEMLSPFADEAEAQAYAGAFARNHPAPAPSSTRVHTDAEMFDIAAEAAAQSFAYSEHQIGVALGQRTGTGYRFLAATHNVVVPYETYAMHHGASRERNFSPMNDLNHYDVNHAEVELIIKVGKEGIDLKGTTLFINVLPCPTCARMFTQTDIAEFVYREDHSDGYAVKMLELAGKKVRRVVQ